MCVIDLYLGLPVDFVCHCCAQLIYLVSNNQNRSHFLFFEIKFIHYDVSNSAHNLESASNGGITSDEGLIWDRNISKKIKAIA